MILTLMAGRVHPVLPRSAAVLHRAHLMGKLLLDATLRASRKTSCTHTSTAPCGCSATVSWFTEHSTANRLEYCSDHEPEKS